MSRPFKCVLDLQPTKKRFRLNKVLQKVTTGLMAAFLSIVGMAVLIIVIKLGGDAVVHIVEWLPNLKNPIVVCALVFWSVLTFFLYHWIGMWRHKKER